MIYIYYFNLLQIVQFKQLTSTRQERVIRKLECENGGICGKESLFVVFIFSQSQYQLNMIKRFLRNAVRSNHLAPKNYYRFNNQVPKFDPSKDYYSILQVTKDSADAQIKKSYYRLAKLYHPDSSPGKQTKFKQINEAYTVLSDSKIKKQYDAARSFQGFSRRMRSKASQGSFRYEQYQGMYKDLSPEQQQQIIEQFKARARKVMIFGLVMIIILPFLTRRNHKFFILQDGELIPVEFEGGIYGGMMPPPGAMGPYGGAPYPGGTPNQPNMGPYNPNSSPYYNQGPRNPYQQVVRNMPPPSSPYQQQQGYRGYQ